MKRLSSAAVTLGIIVVSATIMFAQQAQPAAPPQGGQGGRGGAPGGQAGGGRGAPFPPPTNLQVLPKDIAVPDLQAAMNGIAQSMGVQCNYCHVPPAAPPAPAAGAAAAPPAAGGARGGRGGAPQLDFALDDKAEKKTARLMLKMVNDLNAKLTAEVAPVIGRPAAELTRVQCATCHRGVTKPEQISTVLSGLMLSKGEAAAVAKYRELRTGFYGAQAYDFSEVMLVRLAQASLAANKTDDAMGWLKLNLEFYPRSSQSYVQMSQVYTRKMDTPSAITAMEKAVELDPDNMATKRQLDTLKGVAPAAPAGRGAPPAQ
ncbi:MAG: photosynthetic reaction center cytochrome c subunit family protein [Vicinamibacterales bacterium]